MRCSAPEGLVYSHVGHHRSCLASAIATVLLGYVAAAWRMTSVPRYAQVLNRHGGLTYALPLAIFARYGGARRVPS